MVAVGRVNDDFCTPEKTGHHIRAAASALLLPRPSPIVILAPTRTESGESGVKGMRVGGRGALRTGRAAILRAEGSRSTTRRGGRAPVAPRPAGGVTDRGAPPPAPPRGIAWGAGGPPAARTRPARQKSRPPRAVARRVVVPARFRMGSEAPRVAVLGAVIGLLSSSLSALVSPAASRAAAGARRK